MHSTEAGVLLLDADPDLGVGLSDEEFAVARRHLRARVRVLDEGPWNPPDARDRAGDLGLLVVDGVLVRDVSVRGRCCAELLGTGDVLRPWDQTDAVEASVGHSFRWEVLQRTLLAEIDARVVATLGRWPSIASALVGRSLRRVRTMGLQYALTQVQGVDVRLHLALWHLADRWGRVTPEGVVLRLPLTHQLLGRLIGARRPSVTSALQRLHRDGLVVRTDDGAWLLHGAPDEVELQHEPSRRRAELTAAA
ncbi:MAG TPA: helix-turn-helix domain-containing protein [Solirubrobacteraceae bacterium]|nr:helix-turn-helix domain-containing protein [Solirubrobacteraceae bacterium]